MSVITLLCSVVILLAIIATRFSNFIGMPALLFFMGLGLLFGSEGLLKISFENYELSRDFCSIALSVIIFYGGFCTNWKSAKPVSSKALVLSSIGVIITSFLTCLFCHFALGFQLLESLLIGAVISSTDAASVFSILRSKRLNLKENTASLLELESGSNDPFAYILMMVALTLMHGQSIGFAGIIFVKQLFIAALTGVLIAAFGVFVFKKTKFTSEANSTLFVIALFMLSFAIPEMLESNEYLSVYITGIILGNAHIMNKKIIIHFFDGLTGLSQIFAFFMLGLLAFPHKISGFFITALLIAIFLTFIARPIAVFLTLLPFKSSFKQCLLVSWAGLRGAASIVFAIIAVGDNVFLTYDLFHIVFLVCLLSVGLQGSLLPCIASKLNMIDDVSDVSKTFNDYQKDASIKLSKIKISNKHEWANCLIKDIVFPDNALALMIRRNGKIVIPNGDTTVLIDDVVVLSVPVIDMTNEIMMNEVFIRKKHKWCNKKIKELNLPKNGLIVMVKRDGKNIIPKGNTLILENDTVVVYN